VIPGAVQWRGLLLAITERALMIRRGRAYSNLSFRPRNAVLVWAWPFPEGSLCSTAARLPCKANKGRERGLQSSCRLGNREQPGRFSIYHFSFLICHSSRGLLMLAPITTSGPVRSVPPRGSGRSFHCQLSISDCQLDFSETANRHLAIGNRQWFGPPATAWWY